MKVLATLRGVGIPAGGIDTDETARGAAARALAEETGLRVDVQELVELPTLYRGTDSAEAWITVVFATRLRRHSVRGEGHSVRGGCSQVGSHRRSSATQTAAREYRTDRRDRQAVDTALSDNPRDEQHGLSRVLSLELLEPSTTCPTRCTVASSMSFGSSRSLV